MSQQQQLGWDQKFTAVVFGGIFLLVLAGFGLAFVTGKIQLNVGTLAIALLVVVSIVAGLFKTMK